MLKRNKTTVLKDDNLVVKFDGIPLFSLNKSLVETQGVQENVEAIKDTHELKFLFGEMIKLEKNNAMIKALADDIRQCEFELQKLWKFSEDDRFHRFWETPKCECPKMDNEDRYPTGQYVINLSCPIHGNK